MIAYDVATKLLDTESFPQHNIAGLISGITFILLSTTPLSWKKTHTQTHTHTRMHAPTHTPTPTPTPTPTHTHTHTHTHTTVTTLVNKILTGIIILRTLSS